MSSGNRLNTPFWIHSSLSLRAAATFAVCSEQLGVQRALRPKSRSPSTRASARAPITALQRGEGLAWRTLKQPPHRCPTRVDSVPLWHVKEWEMGPVRTKRGQSQRDCVIQVTVRKP